MKPMNDSGWATGGLVSEDSFSAPWNLPGGVWEESSVPGFTPSQGDCSAPQEKEISDYQDFTEKPRPWDTVDILARVSGYLQDIRFQRGRRSRKTTFSLSSTPVLFKPR